VTQTLRVVLAFLLLGSCVLLWPGRSRLQGTPAPAIDGRTTTGDSWRLADQAGKVVLVDFWATWCGPCRHTLPQIKAIQAEHQDNPEFVVVGVSLDSDPREVITYAQQAGLSWPNLIEPGRGFDNTIAQSYGVRSIPHTVLIGRDGSVLAEDLHGKRLREAVRRALES
jgi:thiol-disulfide isomerase/thioredoxin